MRLAGLVGGMGWPSTALYYRRLNEAVAERLGGHHNAASLLHTLDFAPLLAAAQADDPSWTETVAAAAAGLERGGAAFVALTSVTGHLAAETCERRLRVPFLHIADAVADAALEAGAARVGLLGTRLALASPAVVPRLEARGLSIVIPEPSAAEAVDTIILRELTQGRFPAGSRARVQDEAVALRRRGADLVALACTELPLLVSARDLGTPALDAVEVHVARMRDALLEEAS